MMTLFKSYKKIFVSCLTIEAAMLNILAKKIILTMVSLDKEYQGS